MGLEMYVTSVQICVLEMFLCANTSWKLSVRVKDLFPISLSTLVVYNFKKKILIEGGGFLRVSAYRTSAKPEKKMNLSLENIY